MFERQEQREKDKELREIQKHEKEMELLAIQKELALAQLKQHSWIYLYQYIYNNDFIKFSIKFFQ